MCVKKPETHEVSEADQQIANEYEGISRALYDDYIQNFRGFEIDAVEDNLDNEAIQERTQRTRTDAFNAWESGRGVTARALSDYGVNLTADQKAAQERSYAQTRSASIDNTTNESRRIEEDRQITQGNALFNAGRIMANQALNSYGQAASLEAARGERNVNALNQYEQDKASRTNKIWGTVAAAALTVATGGAGAPLLAASVAGG